MELDKENYKIIVALALGAMGGLLLGNYLGKTQGRDRTLSKHLASLSQVMEQIEDIDTEEVKDLKHQILKLLDIIENSYVKNKE